MDCIRSLHVRAVRVPMSEPHRTAGGVVTESPLVLTDVVSADGAVGHSMVFTYTAAALKPTAQLISNLAPLVEEEPLAPAALEQKLARHFRLLGPQGLVGIALAAIDMAVWDAVARQQGRSLLEVTGHVARPQKAYGAVGFDGVNVSAQIAERWAQRGFAGVKVKIGYPSVEEDLAVIRAIRHAVGPSMAIMVDYNQCLTPVAAIERIRHLDEENLTWIEEPTLAHDYAGHARIARAVVTPIQCGENWWGTMDMQHAIDAQASDYMMPEVMKIGGVTGWLRAAQLAGAHGIPVSTHLWPELSAQLLCCAPTAHWLEYADWWNPVLARPLAIEQGMARLDGVVGTGIEWDEAAVARYAA